MKTPLSLYVHIPWCVRKCPYCDFNSHTAAAIPETDYVAALVRDLSREAERTGGPLRSVFFGGGTPSLFSPAAIGAVLAAAEQRFGFAPGVEITLEANPGTAEYGNLTGYRAAGVNRLSFGIQSFDDQALTRLGRIHSAGEARAAYEAARRAGFDNINLDLMYGLPEQSPEQAERDLAAGIALAPEHLSWYQLTLEPNTVFYNAPPPLPQDDDLAAMGEAGVEQLAAAGYNRYEVSAYATAGRECRHNRNYWEFGDYLGVGAGAHGKLTTDGAIVRTAKTRKPADYLARGDDFSAGTSEIEPAARPLEFFMNALRLRGGVPAALFEARTGAALATVAPILAELRRRELLAWAPAQLVTTPLGYRFLNDVIAAFDSI